MTDVEQAMVEYNLFRSIATTIRRNDAGTSNFQAWHNAAVGGIGFLFEDADLIDFSIHDPDNGFLFQLQNSVMDDGMWYENSIGTIFFYSKLK